tara:strand:+ start:177 stop:530 length:354 start_codon:yes stop_codon:yes gene_type:complete
MYWGLAKLLITSVLIFIISEVAKRSVILGGFLAALPLVSIISMVWMKLEGVDLQIINQFSRSIFWIALPSLPMFYLFPVFSQRWGFNIAFILSITLTSFLYIVMASIISKWGINLSI